MGGWVVGWLGGWVGGWVVGWGEIEIKANSAQLKLELGLTLAKMATLLWTVYFLCMEIFSMYAVATIFVIICYFLPPYISIIYPPLLTSQQPP